MKILVIGSWRTHVAASVAEEAATIGRLLAQDRHELVTGGGTGVSKHVVDAYRAAGGKQYTAYLPSVQAREAVGEAVGPPPDTIIDTHEDYPARNVILMRGGEGVIALDGGLGTLSEIIHAVNDYHRPLAVIDKGNLPRLVRAIPELHEKVFLTTDCAAALAYVTRPR